jgi:hypothetical protein
MKTSSTLLVVALLGLSTVTACSTSTEEVDAAEGAQTKTAGVPALGDYEAKTDARYGGLKITKASATSLEFALEVYNNFGANNMGFADGVAKGAGGQYTYTAEDCKITFKVAKANIEIAQDGICGMGNNVYATGTYAPKPPPPPVTSLCDEKGGEQVIFGCKTVNAKVISICGYKGAVQYRFGTSAKTEMKLPAEMAPIFEKPTVAEGGFISLAGPGAGGAWATFHNGAYDYTVVTINSSLGLDEEGLSKGTVNTSGVVVSQGGKRVAFVKCAEEPTSDLPADSVAASSKPFDMDLMP